MPSDRLTVDIAGALAALNEADAAFNDAVRVRDWGEACGHAVDAIGAGRIALNAIMNATPPQPETAARSFGYCPFCYDHHHDDEPCPSQPVSGDVVAANLLREVLTAHDEYSDHRNMPSAKRYDGALQAAQDFLDGSALKSQPSKGVTLVGELCEWPNGDLYLDDVRLGGALAATNLHREDVDPERLPGHETYGPVTVSITPKEQA